MITIAKSEIARAIAIELLDVGAIQIRPTKPFTWASGWKSPIYCDNRLALSFPETRSIIKHYLADVIRSKFPEAEAIAGVATAGIPQGVLVAESLDLPFMYVRSKPKGHGMENLVEGKLEKGQKVVLVEDLVSTGGSSIKAAEALHAAGAEILGMAAIFTYGFDVAVGNFEKANIKLVCLSDYPHLLEEALSKKLIQNDELDTLKEWKDNPSGWNPAH
ncbi:orotate phosphoribosyltransferase [Marivirga harenae]|uniref:orotate phosphoribosyltransferase n=1 Tax=Marivirga harenae TaxID=2010992 RepID=UPI0026DF2262|nr:orotate phosphoribosyltransferase [Marivirga harenae]WKV12162.1 orotate phosphoribosyltransferase [Marivirga harenae]|tara:strand:- start:293062 stop:293715 length:654 start_codon:yes stop_codon:yes gene_type:complete